MPYSPGANNQSYLDPTANTQRNNITSALMRTAAPPPQTQMPGGMMPQLPSNTLPPMPPPQMPPPGTSVPQLPGAAMPGMPTPGMPPPNVPLSGGVPPVQQPGMMPQGAMPAPGPRGY